MQRAVVGATKSDQIFGGMLAAISLAAEVVHFDEGCVTAARKDAAMLVAA
jgi:hypothetical protein